MLHNHTWLVAKVLDRKVWDISNTAGNSVRQQWFLDFCFNTTSRLSKLSVPCYKFNFLVIQMKTFYSTWYFIALGSFHLIKEHFPLKEGITVLTSYFPFSKRELVLFWGRSPFVHFLASPRLPPCPWACKYKGGPFPRMLDTLRKLWMGAAQQRAKEGKALGVENRVQMPSSTVKSLWNPGQSPWLALQLSLPREKRQGVETHSVVPAPSGQGACADLDWQLT